MFKLNKLRIELIEWDEKFRVIVYTVISFMLVLGVFFSIDLIGGNFE